MCFDGTLGIRALWLVGSIMCYVVNLQGEFLGPITLKEWQFVPIETKWGIRSLFSWSIPPSVHQDTYFKQTLEPNHISQDAQEAILWAMMFVMVYAI